MAKRKNSSGLTDLGGVAWVEDGGEGGIEGGLRVGVGWVEVGDGGIEEFFQGQVGFADAVDDAAGELVGAVAVEVGVVADGFGLAGEGAGGVVHEGFEGAFGTYGFEEALAHGVEGD